MSEWELWEDRTRAGQLGGTREQFGQGLLRKGEKVGETAHGVAWSSVDVGEGLMPRMHTR